MTVHANENRLALLSGFFYLIIIFCGLTAEFALRGPVLAYPSGVAEAMRGALSTLRVGLVADAVMISADAALAVTLFLLLRTAAPGLALVAMVFRLLQAATLSATALIYLAAIDSAAMGQDGTAAFLMGLHGDGYDFGLIFFGVNTLVMAALLRRVGAPAGLWALLGLAGLVYLTGSLVRFLAPELHSLVEPAYLIAIVAELWFCFWLLYKGLRGTAPLSQPAAA